MRQIIVTDPSHLPVLTEIENLYCDLETTSGDPKITSLDPWKNCSIAGIAVTADDLDTAWYVPVGHAFGRNMPRHRVIEWMRDTMRNSRRWVNHNVKYDMHCMKNDFSVEPPDEVRCTVVSAKTLDSDRYYSGGYSLDALTRAWLNRGDDDGKKSATLKPYLVKNKDFGRVPIDVLGPYACQDVFLARDLDVYIETRMHPDSALVHEIEQKMTLALFDMEQRGLRVDPVELQKEQLKSMTRMLMIEQEIAELTGVSMNPCSSKDCYDLFCVHYGAPVMQWNDEEGLIGSAQHRKEQKHTPSFSKTGLERYRKVPGIPLRLIDLMIEYRHIHQYNSLFVESYQELMTQAPDGTWRLHPQYNQAVKTFRMSCSNPNAQQASKEGLALVHPDPGRAFVAMDMEQEELRIIAHYTKSGRCMQGYRENSDMDYHAWCGEMCGGIGRQFAKQINFTMAYGGGKNRIFNSILKWGYEEIAGMLKPRIDGLIAAGKVREEQRQQVLDLLIHKRVEEIWDTFNESLPEMKNTRTHAAKVFERRGFVRNLYGRRLSGPAKLSYIAFNKIIQSTAAEFFKDRTVAVTPRFCPEMRERDAHPVASVHDSLLFDMPIEASRDREFLRWIRQTLCEPLRLMRVPLRASCSVSELNWALAAKDKAEELRCKDWLGPYVSPCLPAEDESPPQGEEMREGAQNAAAMAG
jgi:DNA polymerase I-like protein with 3'-5' exonuclease and polymerase domains